MDSARTAALPSLGKEIFIEAGLREPSLRIDAVVGGPSKFPYGIVAAAIHNLSPAIERLELASEIELEPGALERQMREEAVACKGVALSPALIGAWSQKQA